MYVKLNFDKYKKYVSYKEEFDENSQCKYIITKITKYTDDNKRIFPRVRTTSNDYASSTS